MGGAFSVCEEKRNLFALGIKKVQIKVREKYEEKLLCEGTCADRSGKHGFCAGIRGGGDGRPLGTGGNGGAG